MFIRTILLCATVGVSSAFASITCAGNENPTGTQGAAVLSSNWNGCLTAAGGGLTVNPDPGPWEDISVIWSVAQTGSEYTYTYRFLDVGSTKGLSHIILGVSDTCGSGCITGQSYTTTGDGEAGPRTFSPTDPGNSNPGLPGSLYGLKINTGPAGLGSDAIDVQFSFKSLRVPVWQDVYGKDGKDGGNDVYFYNTGFNVAGLSYYIVAPDTNVVPEPGFYGLLGCAFGALWLVGRRRKPEEQA